MSTLSRLPSQDGFEKRERRKTTAVNLNNPVNFDSYVQAENFIHSTAIMFWIFIAKRTIPLIRTTSEMIRDNRPRARSSIDCRRDILRVLPILQLGTRLCCIVRVFRRNLISVWNPSHGTYVFREACLLLNTVATRVVEVPGEPPPPMGTPDERDHRAWESLAQSLALTPKAAVESRDAAAAKQLNNRKFVRD